MAQVAREVMESHVLTVGLNDPLDSVRRFFFDEEIHGAPVVDEQRRVVGIISTTDLLRAAYEKLDSERPLSTFTDEGIEAVRFDAEEPANTFIVPPNAALGQAIFTCTACATFQGVPPSRVFGSDHSAFTVQ